VIMKVYNILAVLFAFSLLLVTPIYAQDDEDPLPKWNATIEDQNNPDSDAANLFYFQKNPPPGWNSNLNWYSICAMAIMVCLSVNMLVMMAAKAFSLPELERWAKKEFFQVTASALIIVGFIAMINTGFNVISQTLLPSGTTTTCEGIKMDVWQDSGPMGIMQCKLQEKITYIEDMVQQLWYRNAENEPLAATCIIVGIQVYCWDWDPSLHSEVEQAHYLSNAFVSLGINLHAQFMFVTYIASNMLTVFLPLGIILRIIPITRGIGGILIAIAIGFYFVFPVAYIILDPTTSRPSPGEVIQADKQVLEKNKCFSSFSGLVNVLTAPDMNFGSVQQRPAMTLQQASDEMAKMRAEVFFNPLAALGAAIIFIVSVAPLLGGEAGELTRFVTKVI
jgi:hypothetical protein